jgi:hypothetical protein
VVRICERTWEPELPGVSCACDRRDRVPARGGEHAEHSKHERETADGTGPSCDSDTLRAGNATDWQVGEERVELALRQGCVEGFKPFFKLVRTEPPLGGRAP